MFFVALLYALLASTFILAKKALGYGQPFFLIGFRMTLAGFFLLSFSFFKKTFFLKKEDLWLFLKVSLFHIYLSFILEFWALQYLSALKTTLIYSTTPFVAALLSFILLKERLGFVKTLGIGIGFCGMIPIFMVAAGSSGITPFFSLTLPDIVLFGAVVSGAYAWFLVKDLLLKGYSLPLINGVAMLIGGIFSFMTSFIFETKPFIYSWNEFLFWVIALIIVSNVIVYNFYGWLLHRYSITFLTFAGFLCPSFAMIYDWIFLGGSLEKYYVVSLVFVTVGLYVFYKQELFSKNRKDIK